MPDAVLFFAAGLGTRMRPLTNDRPKPLIEVSGKTLLDHALEPAAGVARRVVNLHYKAEMIRAHLKDRPDILFSDETDALLDTGGGLRKALPLLGEGPVLTMNTDAVWKGPNPFETLLRAWDPDSMDALLLLVPQDRAIGHTGHGDFRRAEDGRISRGPGTIYTGAQIINPAGLSKFSEPSFSLNLLWDDILARNRLFGAIFPGQWCDVGRPDCISLAEEMLAGDVDA